MECFRSLVEIAGTALHAAGVLVVVGGAVVGTARLLFHRLSGVGDHLLTVTAELAVNVELMDVVRLRSTHT